MKKQLAVLLLATIFVVPAVFGQALPKSPDELKFPPLKWNPPKSKRVQLPCGAVIYMVENHELPLVQGSIFFSEGSARDPEAKLGLTSLMMSVLRTGGTSKHNGEALDEELAFIAAKVGTACDHDRCTISFDCLSKDFDQVWTIFTDVLHRPVFEQKYIDLRKKQMKEALRRENDAPMKILFRKYRELLYPGHPYSRRKDGTSESLDNITRDDIVAQHKMLLSPSRMIVGFSGDFDPADVKKRVEALIKDWPWKETELKPLPTVPKNREGLFIVNKELAQTSLIVAHSAPSRPYPDYHAVEVMNYILGGGGFSSRMMDRIRNQEGLAYGVGSFFGYGHGRGAFAAYCQTKPESSYRATSLMLEEIRTIRTRPVSEKEISLARDALINGFIFKFEKPETYLSNLLELEFYGEPNDFLQTYVEKISRVDIKEVARVAHKYLKPENIAILLVGNQAALDTAPKDFVPIQLELE
jgi:zinc protease